MKQVFWSLDTPTQLDQLHTDIYCTIWRD